jgi:hypothetical protein
MHCALKNSITITALLATAIMGNAQTSDNTIIWSTVQVPVKLSPKWTITTDVSYRTLGFSVAAFQYTFRTGLRYSLTKQWNVAMGAAHFNTRAAFSQKDHEFIKEYRLFQEAQYEISLTKRLSLQNRFRTEERFFAATATRKAEQSLRLRYRLLAVQTIHPYWKLLIGNEYMHQLTNGDFEFQQNRAQVAVQYIFNPSNQVQVGYIWSKLKNNNQHFITLTYQITISVHGSNQQHSE